MACQVIRTEMIIYYMHDKYAYERLMIWSFSNYTEVQRFMAFGLAGLSVLVDSLSAIKYTYVKVIRDERGLITDFEIKGDYPQF